ncbi:MAG: hypothetical protein F4Z07_11985 [Dehalococcoidia bacterium]|nr:hypothetical protein [Dehalococcoidia bacterium]
MTSPRRPLPPTNRGGAIRREPARDAASWTDVLIALAATALAMAVLVLVAALAGENVAGDEAGRFWALLFAGGLGLSGLFLLLLGLVLLGEGSTERGRYPVPVATGVATGVIVGALVLDGAGRGAVLAPLLLLLLATPPVRQGVAWLLRRSRGGQRR